MHQVPHIIEIKTPFQIFEVILFILLMISTIVFWALGSNCMWKYREQCLEDPDFDNEMNRTKRNIKTGLLFIAMCVSILVLFTIGLALTPESLLKILPLIIIIILIVILLFKNYIKDKRKLKELLEETVGIGDDERC